MKFQLITSLILCLIHLQLISQPTLQWEFSFGGSNSDFGRKILEASDGSMLVIGNSESSDFDIMNNQGLIDAFVFKMDSEGNILWQKHYGGSEYDLVYDIKETEDGDFILVGSSDSSDGDLEDNYGLSDYWVFKINSNGDYLWGRNYGGSMDESGCAVCITSDGGYIVAGDSRSSDVDVSENYGQKDSWVIRLDEDGDILWEQNYGGSNHDKTTSVIEIEGGDIILLTGTESDDFDVSENYSSSLDDDNGEDIWVLRLDSDGNIIWEQNYGGSGEDSPEDLLKVDDETFVIGGRTSSSNFDVLDPNGSNDGIIFLIDDQGEMAWSNSLGGTGWDRVKSVVKANDSGYYFAGYSNSNDGEVGGNNGDNDFWIGKLNEDGELIWEDNFGGSLYEVTQSIVQSSGGHILVTGQAHSSDIDVSTNNGESDLWLICLANNWPVGIDAINSNKDLLIYPNPVEDELNIFIGSVFEPVEISILDVQGKKVQDSIVHGPQMFVDVKDLESGVYWVRLFSETFYRVERIVIK